MSGFCKGIFSIGLVVMFLVGCQKGDVETEDMTHRVYKR
jgi:hypothetical protein